MFRTESAEDDVVEKGFTELSVLGDRDTAILLDGYRQIVPPGDRGLAIDYTREDRSLTREASELLRSVFEPRLERIMGDHRIVMATFVTKHPGHESDMFLHEDRTFVDEGLHRCVTIWTPLMDVGAERSNGTLAIVPLSHRLAAGWSGTDTPECFRWFEPSLRQRAMELTLPAGRSIAYDSRLLHFSGPNMATQPRVATVIAVAPRPARLIHVVATGRRHRKVYEVDRAFYTDYHPRKASECLLASGRLLDEYDDEASLTPEAVSAVLGSPVEVSTAGLIPYDLRRADDPDEFEPVPTLGRRGPAADSDLFVGIGQAPCHTPGALDVEAIRGGVRTMALRREGRAVGPLPNGLPPTLVGAAEGRGAEADLLILDPHARARLKIAVPAPRTVRLHVLDTPMTTSGMRSEASAHVFAPGDVIDVRQTDRFTLWNDGPGQLVVVARTDRRTRLMELFRLMGRFTGGRATDPGKRGTHPAAVK